MIEKALANWHSETWITFFVCPSSTTSARNFASFFCQPLKAKISRSISHHFHSADVAIIKKMDAAAAYEYDVEAARQNIHTVRPGMDIFEVSAKSGIGMNTVVRF